VDRLAPLLAALRPLLRQHRAKTTYLGGSWARGEADAWSDVDLFVYTPGEFERMRAEERPFLMHALEGSKVIYEG